MKNRIKNVIILIVEKGMFMASLLRNVETMNIDPRKSNPKAIFKGVNYRITILSERLIRLEYDITGEFNDDLTLLVKNRNFNLPNFKVNQDEKYLVITTKYFIMQYSKEKPFKGPNFAPDSNLKIKLINTDKIWYLGHPEARNYKGSAFSIETNNDKVKLDKGLYSTDGFATLDDSFNPLVSIDGFIKKNSQNKIDLYLFMYRRDFGLCLKDYFSLTGFPPLIPRYALGIWWNRDMIYSYEDTKNLIKSFHKYEIPISVLLLNEFWHKKDKNDYNKHKTGFTFNKELFKNPKDFTKYMHDHGVRVGVNIDPIEGISTFENNYPIMAHELGIEKVESVGAYCNIHLKRDLFVKKCLESLQKVKYGVSQIGAGKTVCMDYSSPNIAKNFHVGHLRTTVIGNSLYKIYQKLGYDVVRINHLGDWGTQFGKLIVAYKLWSSEELVKEKGIEELLRIYVKFNAESEKNEDLIVEAREWFVVVLHIK